jgi:hypothetical protein
LQRTKHLPIGLYWPRPHCTTSLVHQMTSTHLFSHVGCGDWNGNKGNFKSSTENIKFLDT